MTPAKYNKVIFNDSIIKENTNVNINSAHSTKQFNPIILLKSGESRGQSPHSFINQKSPSVNEIHGPYNYHLNVRDISSALDELKKSERKLQFSEPSVKQEEFQTLILNQTNLSTGIQSHDFSLCNASLSVPSSNRNSLGVNSNQS